MNGMLYVADIDTIRWFDMKTGEPRGSIPVAGATRFNDIEVAKDGTIYASQTGDQKTPDSWRLYRISAKGEAADAFYVCEEIVVAYVAAWDEPDRGRRGATPLRPAERGG